MCEEKPVGENQSEAAQVGKPQGEATISYDDFVKLDLRVATIIKAANHPNADKLICLKIDLGGQERQIIAGIRGHYELSELVGKQTVVVANLAPRKMRGLESQGMLLAAHSEDETGSSLILVGPEKPARAGSEVS
jgi:methionyl-tRNA synthetase